MLATPERVPGLGQAPDRTMWHKPAGRVVGEFQPIACSDEGIVFPSPKRDVPLRLERAGESWCTDCLTLIRSKPTAGQ